MSNGYSIYPPDWKQTSKRIRERDGYTCQWCGGTPNNVGVAHLNHEPMDCRDENLLTLCWTCHCRYDGKTGANHPGKQARRRATIERNRKAKQEEIERKHRAKEEEIERNRKAPHQLLCNVLDAIANQKRLNELEKKRTYQAKLEAFKRELASTHAFQRRWRTGARLFANHSQQLRY